MLLHNLLTLSKPLQERDELMQELASLREEVEEKSLENWGLPALEKPSTAVPQTVGDKAVGVQSLS